jgi:glutathionyl-hydroquinone reductase
MPKNLPAPSLIQLGRFTWTTMWQIMMAQLAPPSQAGEYIRPESAFHDRVSPATQYPPEAGRYRLFVGMSCPWAHRTLIVREMKGLTTVISVSFTRPAPSVGGWLLAEPYHHHDRLSQLYQQAAPHYQGRATVPVLWDDHTQTIVNNESAEIIEILNSEFNQFASSPTLDLYPATERENIDRWNEQIYDSINNGVYRCGFAQSQSSYDVAVNQLFTMFDRLESHFENHPYLCMAQLTLADVRLFTTLIRFDLVYHNLFKCSRSKIRDYLNLSRYLRQIYHLPGIAQTCDFPAIQHDYYSSLFPLNPGNIVPIAVDMSWLEQPND